MSETFLIKHKNITGMKSYELKDYIGDLRKKEKMEGLSLKEMELFERAMEERDMRRKCKAYYPEKDRHNEYMRRLDAVSYKA